MAFMRIETTLSVWYLVESRYDTSLIPADVCGLLDIPPGETIDDDSPLWEEASAALKDYVGSGIQSIECIGEKWAARYSAPGYMDCTEWTLGDDEADAIAECKGMYGDDEDEQEEEEESREDEPEEDDYTTKDHVHFWQFRKLVLTVPADQDYLAALCADMEQEDFFPNVYFVSDHGNAILIDVSVLTGK